MNTRRHSLLTNLNRVLIFALSLSGLLMDGFRMADLSCALALFVWLWLPLCTRVETQFLHWLGGRHGSVRSPKTSPSI